MEVENTGAEIIEQNNWFGTVISEWMKAELWKWWYKGKPTKKQIDYVQEDMNEDTEDTSWGHDERKMILSGISYV